MKRAFLLCLLALPIGCFAQSTSPLKDALLKIITASDSLSKTFPEEKIYMQFDKPYYALGDTIWFKAYLVDEHLASSGESRIINLDVANDSNQVVKQYRVLVDQGTTRGNINLGAADFKPGTYTLRAYTNWMRNFKEDNFFCKTFYIMNPGEGSFLVNKQLKDTLVNGVPGEDVKLQFTGLDKKPLKMDDLQLRLMDGNKNLYKQKFRTDANGAVDINFAVPQKTGALTMVAESALNKERAVIQVSPDKVTNADVQFLPEGGSLVAGLPAHVGFKAIAADGKGCDISGMVADHAGTRVAAFQSIHNGMGSFSIDVKAGESYVAKVTLPGGAEKDYPLPVVKTSGTVLRINNAMESDSLEVFAAATEDVVQTGSSYYLIGKARGVVCYAAIISLNEGGFSRKIAKSLFPTGIAHFTLMTVNRQPLNERLVFIDRHDDLNIGITADKPTYSSRDSVALKLKVTDNSGNPVEGDFSLAVTDNAQVTTDTTGNGNIISTLLLTSDLKGYVEGPGYYLSAKTLDAWQALDNLLLTQGWVGYDWQQVFNPPDVVFQPEKDFLVKGRVFNVFNKPIKKTDVVLLSTIPAMLLETSTDSEGRFVFDRLPQIDTPVFVIRAVNKSGGSFNVGIKVEETAPPLFTRPYSWNISPWYVNSTPVMLNYNKTDELVNRAKEFPMGGHVLKQVNIKAKKIVHDSQNLNGPGNADIVLDEKDMEKAGKKTWLDLLYESIPGFREANVTTVKHSTVFLKGGAALDVINNLSYSAYKIKYQKAIFIVDGIRLDEFLPKATSFDANLPYRQFLSSQSAEDIKGIEVSYSPKYRERYIRMFVDPRIALPDSAFIEITTRSGSGPFLRNTPGIYLYKPLAISRPMQFYKPKYNLADTARHLPDLRSTIDWEPDIITNANGEATVWFFTGDRPSGYTITVEGTDRVGNLGYKTGGLNVPQAAGAK